LPFLKVSNYTVKSGWLGIIPQITDIRFVVVNHIKLCGFYKRIITAL